MLWALKSKIASSYWRAYCLIAGGAVASGMPRAVAIYVLLFASALTGAPAWGYDRDKSDVVTLQNGDHITGDVISLEYGKLTLNTDKAGTAYIQWPAVRSVSSKFAFAVEKRGGTKYYGVISTSPDGKNLLVGAGDETAQIPMVEVERMSRYASSFWNRINGNLAVGFSYTKASDVTVGGINANAYYRSNAIDGALNFSSNTTRTSSGDDTYRALLNGTTMFVRQSRNFWGLVGSVERDQSLGINARVTAGGVLGRNFVQASFTELTGLAGVVVAQESITGNPEQQTSLEGILGLSWRVFKFTEPETSLDLRIALYPSLTESSRYRGNANLTLTQKIIGDLTLGLTAYWTADTHPPEPTAERSDYGLMFNLGYSFGE
jgi:hypothetical protein